MKESRVGRRELMQAGLAGLAAARLGGSTPAQAGAGAGRVVTPNPDSRAHPVQWRRGGAGRILRPAADAQPLPRLC